MGENDNTTPDVSGEATTGATSPEEVVQDVREQVAAPDAAPVESAPTPEVQSTTVEETASTTVTEASSGDSATPDN